LGPAVNAGKAVFLYGPPGNGKTVIAEGMGRALGGDLYVPYAIDVDGQTVTIYDPICHESLDTDEAASLVKPAPRDRRWVHVKRPVVMVGGELTLDMLDLTFNAIAKFHEAPIHLKANGGVFLVDDFGRQRIRPQELLNRWIVPLESRVDYLTLHNGKKFQVPFDVLTVFATNLDPRSLADEAFLRRIPYKIPVEDPSLEHFTQIFELNCRTPNLRFHQVMFAYLQRRHYALNNRRSPARHRSFAARQRSACRRADHRAPPRQARRSVTRRGNRDSRVARRALACSRVGRSRIDARRRDDDRVGDRAHRRHCRQADVGPQFRDCAGEPRRRRCGPVRVRAASYLRRLPCDARGVRVRLSVPVEPRHPRRLRRGAHL